MSDWFPTKTEGRGQYFITVTAEVTGTVLHSTVLCPFSRYSLSITVGTLQDNRSFLQTVSLPPPSILYMYNTRFIQFGKQLA